MFIFLFTLRLLNSRVLLINVKGLTAEIAKNIVLGGIHSLTILDPNDVTEEDIKLNFLIERTSTGKNVGEKIMNKVLLK